MKKTAVIIALSITAFAQKIVAQQVYANSETDIINAQCTGCYVNNPTQAADQNLSTHSELTLTSTDLHAYICQDLVFSSPGAGANIDVVIEDHDQLPIDAASIANIEVTTFYNNVSNNDTKNSSQVAISPVPGSSSKYYLEINAATAFDAIQVKMHAGVTGADSILRIYDAFYTTTSLPVKMAEFYATVIEDAVKLTWSTITELHNDFFTIERSANGKNFQPIAIVNGFGYSTTRREYSAQDTMPINGLSYYRLKQTDRNGQYEYFPVISVHTGYTPQVSVYPNPCTGQNLYVKIESAEKILLTVTSSNGIVVFSKEYEGSEEYTHHQINFPGELPAGVYFLNATSDFRSETTKIIVERP